MLGIVGLSCGSLASLMDLIIPLLEGFRLGYCPALWKTGKECEGYVEFSGLSGFIIYTLLSLLFTMLSFYFASLGPSAVTNLRTPRTGRVFGTGMVTTDPGLLESVPETMYYCAGSGIPIVKVVLGGFTLQKSLGVRTLFFKILSLIFSISSGLVLGVQGPLVHISCMHQALTIGAIGNITSRLFEKYRTNDSKRREIMSASCAAGVSIAFGSPIGGVLYSLEVGGRRSNLGIVVLLSSKDYVEGFLLRIDSHC